MMSERLRSVLPEIGTGRIRVFGRRGGGGRVRVERLEWLGEPDATPTLQDVRMMLRVANAHREAEEIRADFDRFRAELRDDRDAWSERDELHERLAGVAPAD